MTKEKLNKFTSTVMSSIINMTWPWREKTVIKAFILFRKIKQWWLLPRFGPRSVYQPIPGPCRASGKPFLPEPLWSLSLCSEKQILTFLLYLAASRYISPESLFLFIAPLFSALGVTSQDTQEKHLNFKKPLWKYLLNTMRRVKCWEHRGRHCVACGLER